ncbi:Uncharacterised protein [Mycobacterium tuberculosis]|uniref:Uncharacterized protein n=1 Tax=Mycobacterium tuberculosis TaxID=1773 RepID=A0A654TB23_MYCTX|nr:Uncharacterised protein [Mycobacterium tuberculosis]CKP43760.1 Uncharacterised protein [Mycobacterium tuberculosis]COZ10725.1 Uncharacterised protein [Mycobacterium tuberculosis]COZ91909.1 Uncharacterised protein [Mycobacterium tuberculosis]CPA10792.1 Uncharacterised protein [Mycobacterium tuberculosis]
MNTVTAESIATSSSRSRSTTVPETISRSRWNVISRGPMKVS